MSLQANYMLIAHNASNFLYNKKTLSEPGAECSYYFKKYSEKYASYAGIIRIRFMGLELTLILSR